MAQPSAMEESERLDTYIMPEQLPCQADSILRIYVMLSGEQSSQSKHPIRLCMISGWWLWYGKYIGILRKQAVLVHAQENGDTGKNTPHLSRRCHSDRLQGVEKSE
jgi:hypothetical protein